jgi:mono/diheme cytochrome c family protein
MNLTSANTSYSSMVGVASDQVGLQRVQEGNPASSYLVRKLEGSQSSGDRMPTNGPYLDQATIDRVRSWIQAGALP